MGTLYSDPESLREITFVFDSGVGNQISLSGTCLALKINLVRECRLRFRTSDERKRHRDDFSRPAEHIGLDCYLCCGLELYRVELEKTIRKLYFAIEVIPRYVEIVFTGHQMFACSTHEPFIRTSDHFFSGPFQVFSMSKVYP